MKKLMIATVVVLFGAGGAMADPLDGTVWKTGLDEGSYAHVELYGCGGKICGAIKQSFNSSGAYKSKNDGLEIVKDMVSEGGGHYKGKVLQPSSGRWFTGKMDINGNKMALAGCALGCLIKKTQNWTKIQ